MAALSHSAVVTFDGPTITEDFRVMKSVVNAVINGLTEGDGEGLIFGIANNDLSNAEIEESIEAEGPLDKNDRIKEERATRWVKVLGEFVPDHPTTARRLVGFGDSVGLISKDRWTYNNPEGWQWFIYNIGGSISTGSLLQLIATHYGVWVV
uniref:Uncharacterized protein n=1 Tax=uncultured marine virus TaxID=186617 RepID=S4TE22_9VIRU|nr:hypothetical protein [uncultured marine virus]